MQLRMSKKIAQLTKVIVHLNTKAEDHETDLQEMAETYESEIETMLQDAAAKINSFKSQLEAARDDMRFQEAVAKVQLRYEQERQVRLHHASAHLRGCEYRHPACVVVSRTPGHCICVQPDIPYICKVQLQSAPIHCSKHMRWSMQKLP